MEKARKHLSEFDRLFQQLDDETKGADADVLERRQQLSTVFG